MKKSILISILLLSTINIFSQNDSLFLFNVQTIGADTTVSYFDELGLRTKPGQADIQIRFDSLNCKDLKFDAGFTLRLDNSAIYPSSSGEILLPQALDTTLLRAAPNSSQLLFSRYLINNERKWSFLLRYEWDRGWIVYTIYTGTCTRGRIWRLR